MDGKSHDGRFLYDAERQQFLESLGFTVLRFNDADVKRDLPNVLMAIEGWIEKRLKQPPAPPLLRGNKQPPLSPFSKGEITTHGISFPKRE